jgi:hypothetical protein
LRIVIWIILFCLLNGVSGCLCRQNFGEPSDDLSRRAALLNESKSHDANEVVFRTLIHWGTREISLVEVVKVFQEGGFSVAAVTDIGTTLYSARIDKDGKGHIISNALPVSTRWLLENLVTELLIPWNGPGDTCRLYRLPEEKWAMVDEANNNAKIFIFNEAGKWLEFRRTSGCRVRCRASFEWGQRRIPKVIRVDNIDKHYHVVRESISITP